MVASRSARAPRWASRATVAALAAALAAGAAPAAAQTAGSVTVPVALDHNRMLVRADVQRRDGSWRPALLWIDTGNPEFMLSESFARDLGYDVDGGRRAAGGGPLFVAPPSGVRVGGMALEFAGVRTRVNIGARQFLATHADANLPSTVLQHLHVVLDYPRDSLTWARPTASCPPRSCRGWPRDTPTGRARSARWVAPTSGGCGPRRRPGPWCACPR